jgi:hypothetical protein
MGDVRGGRWRHADTSWTWERLATEAKERDDVVLVTKETFAAATADEAAKALARLEPEEVHVVVTIRDLARTLPSWWQQGVKAGSQHPFESWLEGVRAHPDAHSFWLYHDPISIMRRWAPEFPADRVHVVTVPKPSSEPVVLWERFASVIGVDPTDYAIPARPLNRSLGAVEAELLRRVNVAVGDSLPLREPYLSTVLPWFTVPALLKGSTTSARFDVPPEYDEWLCDRALRTIAELREYPCEVVGDLDDLLPAASTGRTTPGNVAEGDIADRAVEAIARTLVHRHEHVLESRPHVVAVGLLRRAVRLLRRVWRGARRRLRGAVRLGP